MHELPLLAHNIWLRICMEDARDMQDWDIEGIRVEPLLVVLLHDIDLSIVHRTSCSDRVNALLCRHTKSAVCFREEREATTVHQQSLGCPHGAQVVEARSNSRLICINHEDRTPSVYVNQRHMCRLDRNCARWFCRVASGGPKSRPVGALRNYTRATLIPNVRQNVSGGDVIYISCSIAFWYQCR